MIQAFYLEKQAGVNIDEVRLKRAEERRKQREKLANLQTCTGITFPQGVRVHYYNRENAPNGTNNTRNANIQSATFEILTPSLMIQNALFRQCLAAIPEEQKAEFELSFEIAERISELLKEKNLTQKDLAQKLHKRESEISKWLTGRHNFTMQTIAKIETALGCKLINIAK